MATGAFRLFETTDSNNSSSFEESRIYFMAFVLCAI